MEICTLKKICLSVSMGIARVMKGFIAKSLTSDKFCMEGIMTTFEHPLSYKTVMSFSHAFFKLQLFNAVLLGCHCSDTKLIGFYYYLRYYYFILICY
jgi:hypothetical protein